MHEDTRSVNMYAQKQWLDTARSTGCEPEATIAHCPALVGEMSAIAELVGAIGARLESLDSGLYRLGAHGVPRPGAAEQSQPTEDSHLGNVRETRRRLEVIFATVDEFADRLNSVV